MYKNFLIALTIVVVTGTGLYATNASALTAGDVQAQIAKLQQQISDLTAQIARLRGQNTAGPSVTGSSMPAKHRICYLLTRNLDRGAEGDDVRSLQEFLRENKFLTVEPTGFFGEVTADAVRRWQTSEGVTAAGAFGPLSRERLKIWCGGGWGNNQERFSATPVRGEAPLSVTFNTWISGFRVSSIYYTIDFGDGTSERAADCPAPADACTGPGQNKHTYSSNGTYTATLSKVTDPCAGNVACRAAIHSEVVAKQQIVVGTQACTKEYRPVCGSKPIVCITTPCNPIPTEYGNKCMMEADGATFLYEGQCRSENPADDPQCKAWFDGCNSCARTNPGDPAACTLKYCVAPGKAYCTARFTDATNKPPVISSFSGPTTLQEDVQGTWTVKAKDPEGGNLSYQVWWGDENVYASNYTTVADAQGFTQATSFTHAYSYPGTYTVQITVRDSSGSEARTTATVKVIGNSAVDDQPGGFCTADAYQCPNGNWVGRTGPNCQFICPASNNASCTMNGEWYAHGSTYRGAGFVADSPAYTCNNGTWTR